MNATPHRENARDLSMDVDELRSRIEALESSKHAPAPTVRRKWRAWHPLVGLASVLAAAVVGLGYWYDRGGHDTGVWYASVGVSVGVGFILFIVVFTIWSDGKLTNEIG